MPSLTPLKTWPDATSTMCRGASSLASCKLRVHRRSYGLDNAGRFDWVSTRTRGEATGFVLLYQVRYTSSALMWWARRVQNLQAPSGAAR